MATVDEDWFAHASDGEILGVPVRLCPVEEMIWSKAYVQERERFDGADIAHLIRSRGEALDWARLLRRFGEHWRVLFGHLILFGFIYPAERGKIPAWVLKIFAVGWQRERGAVARRAVCFGTLSRASNISWTSGSGATGTPGSSRQEGCLPKRSPTGQPRSPPQSDSYVNNCQFLYIHNSAREVKRGQNHG